MTHDEIVEKVKAVLVDALGVDEEEVTPTAVLRDDLGAESIDYLDIAFRLEKTFGIRINKGEMFPENIANDPSFVQNDTITPAGIEELRKRMPFSDVALLEADPKLDNMSKLFTVDMIAKFVESKVASLPAT